MMYEDLARSQRRSPLEWLVVNTLLPSLLVTFVLQVRADGHTKLRASRQDPIICVLPVMGMDEHRFGPVPDLFPVLLHMPPPDVPVHSHGGGRVFLRALVDTLGRIRPASIVVVQSPDADFDDPARRALAAAVFRPARLAGKPISAWITIAVTFNVPGE